MNIKESAAYLYISNFYGDMAAERSKVPLINHIDEGLVVLNTLGAEDHTMLAWCIHPLLQSDASLIDSLTDCEHMLSLVDPIVLILAMEYRNQANQWLRNNWLKNDPPSIPLHEVHQMLIADKIQKYKDVMQHQQDNPEINDLEEYFKGWMMLLGIDEERMWALIRLIEVFSEEKANS